MEKQYDRMRNEKQECKTSHIVTYTQPVKKNRKTLEGNVKMQKHFVRRRITDYFCLHVIS